MRGMPGDEDYQFVDILFPFLVAFIDHAKRFRRNFTLIAVHLQYSELLLKLIRDWDDEDRHSKSMRRELEFIEGLKELKKNTFAAQC